MAEQIHYYKTISGSAHFAETGVVKAEAKLGQYLRMLRYAKKSRCNSFWTTQQIMSKSKGSSISLTGHAGKTFILRTYETERLNPNQKSAKESQKGSVAFG